MTSNEIYSLLKPVNIHHVFKTCGFLFLFLLAFPITLIITCITFIIHFFVRKPTINNPHAKRILISGGGMTKALQLARSLHSAGHYIVLTDEYSYPAHRYSRSVSNFYVCGITENASEYIQSIFDIVKKEKIDIFIPVSHSTCECIDALVGEALIPLNCQTLHGDIKQLNLLSDKYLFIDRARSLGLTVPKTVRITDPQQILNYDFSKEKRQFILKPLQYDSVARTNIIRLPCQTREKTIAYVNSLIINEEHPWVMQEFISGKEYCTHGTFHHGKLRLYACCRSSEWLLNYKHIENKSNILKWVEDFCSRTNIHGQASFDFIEGDDDGLIYPLECNPRTHTAITAFYNNPYVAEAYLGTEDLLNGPIVPKSNARMTYWLYHELWNLFKIRRKEDLIKILKLFLFGKEAVYSTDDPLPFFLHYTMHMPRLLIFNLIHLIPFKKVDCNLALLL